MLLRARVFGLILIVVGNLSLASGQGAVESFEGSDNSYLIDDGFAVGWTLTAEALWLQRASGPLVTASDTTGGTSERAFAGDRLQPGVRFGLQRFGFDGNTWEFSYFGLQQWSEAGNIAGDPVFFSKLVQSPNLHLDDLIGGFDSSVGFSYHAQTHNVELNRWWTLRDDGYWIHQWMLGARYFNFEERLTMVGVDSTFGSEFLDAASYNYLVGGQLGVRTERTWDRWSVFAVGKVGIYGNQWSSRLADVVVPSVGFPPPDINGHNRDIGFAGLLEGLFGFRYQITDQIGIRCGYNLLYVPGVALQSTPSAAELNDSGNLFLHGASMGCDINW